MAARTITAMFEIIAMMGIPLFTGVDESPCNIDIHLATDLPLNGMRVRAQINKHN